MKSDLVPGIFVGLRNKWIVKLISPGEDKTGACDMLHTGLGGIGDVSIANQRELMIGVSMQFQKVHGVSRAGIIADREIKVIFSKKIGIHSDSKYGR